MVTCWRTGKPSTERPEDVRVLWEGAPIVGDGHDNGGGGGGSIAVGEGDWFATGKEAGLSNLTIYCRDRGLRDTGV